MLFEDNSFDVNIPFFIPDVDFDSLNDDDKKLVSPMEGLARGNMFKDEYKPYKNYTYFKITPNSDKENMLYKIMSLSFAINDLNLYLDLHPLDQEMFTLFKKYVDEKNQLCKEYERIYGPLEITGEMNSYNWLDSPWPWDKRGGNQYV